MRFLFMRSREAHVSEQATYSSGRARIVARLDALAFAVLLITTFLLPLVMLPTAVLPLQLVKFSVLALGVVATLLLWAAARLFEHGMVLPNTLALWTPFALVAGYVVSALLSHSVIRSFIGFGLERDTVLAMLVFTALLAAVALIAREARQLLRLQQAVLVAFLVVGLVQLTRLLLGADSVFPQLFGANATTTLLGSWNDLAVYSGLAMILALSGLALLRGMRIFLYATLALALFFAMVVNVFAVWVTLTAVALILVLFLFSVASYGEGGSFRPRIPWVQIAPSLVVLVISGVFLVIGTGIGDQFARAFGVGYLDVRPSWQATITVGNGVYQDDAFFGIGPNAFSDAWAQYKPQRINETPLWDTDFAFGAGFIPTAFISGGLVVGLLWLIFLASFAWLGFRVLITRLTQQPLHAYLGVSAVLAALYLWAMAVVYIPQLTMLALAFLFTGAAIAAAHALGVTRSIAVRAENGRVPGFVLVASIFVIGIVSMGALLVQAERVYASTMLSRTVAAVNAGDLERAERLLARVPNIGSDTRAQRLQTTIGIRRMARVVADAPEDVDVARNEFQQALSSTITSAQRAVDADRENYRNWMLLGDVYAQLVPLEIQGAAENARQAYEQALARNSRTPAIPMRLARVALAENDIPAARRHIQDALSDKSNYADAHFLLSQIEIQEGNVAAAIESTQNTALLQPQNAGLYFQLGLLYYSQERYTQAEDALEQAVSIAPNYANALYFLGLTRDRLDNRTGALTAFQKVRETNQDNQEVRDIIQALENGGSAFDAFSATTTAPSERDELPISEGN